MRDAGVLLFRAGITVGGFAALRVFCFRNFAECVNLMDCRRADIARRAACNATPRNGSDCSQDLPAGGSG